MNPTALDDEEVDFLALVDGEKADVTEQSRGDTQHETVVHISSDEDAHLSEVPTGQPPQTEIHDESSLGDFKNALYEFYARYNFGNLDKVPYLAEKFFFRRWELWKQLSIKYHLSPRESAELWVRFNLRFDGVPECARRLFGSHETVVVTSDSARRKAIWVSILLGTSDNHKEQYRKHSDEIQHRMSEGKINTISSQSIQLDVIRTHQELGFFQDVCLLYEMIRYFSRIRPRSRWLEY